MKKQSQIVQVNQSQNELFHPSQFEEDLAQYAKESPVYEPIPGGQFISIRGGLHIAGEPVQDNKINCIIVASIHENAFYEGDFDPDSPASPVCYSFSQDGKNMFAHEEALKPQNLADYDDGIQRSPCSSCKQNVMGSADFGRGKACKNARRLALISANVTPEEVEGADVLYLKVPVTSVKNWGKYVHFLKANARMPWQMITMVEWVPHAKYMLELKFKPVAQIDDVYIRPLKEKVDKAMQEIMFPYFRNAQVEE